jgi:hypothetical protein
LLNNNNSEPKNPTRFVQIETSYLNKKELHAGLDGRSLGQALKAAIVGMAILVTLACAAVAAATVFHSTASLMMAGMTFAVVAGVGIGLTYLLTRNN